MAKRQPIVVVADIVQTLLTGDDSGLERLAGFGKIKVAQLLAAYSDTALGRIMSGDTQDACELLGMTPFRWHGLLFETGVAFTSEDFPPAPDPVRPFALVPAFRGLGGAEAGGPTVPPSWLLQMPAHDGKSWLARLTYVSAMGYDPGFAMLQLAKEKIVPVVPTVEDLSELTMPLDKVAALLGPVALWPACQQLFRTAEAVREASRETEVATPEEA